MKTCSVSICEKVVTNTSMCSSHRHRKQRYGDPLVVKKVHGEDRQNDPAYTSYRDMLRRCNNENSKYYSYYGGRGITVSERWIGVDGFGNFKSDMGSRKPGLTLDRIDPNGNYEPSNCRWATRTVQLINQNLNSRNKSGHKGVWWDKNNKFWLTYITLNGKRKHLGCFQSKLEAIEARKEAENMYFKPLLEVV